MRSHGPPEIISVSGQLNKEKILKISQQVDVALHRLSLQSEPAELILVVDSCGGLVNKIFYELIQKIRSTKIPTAAKIYKAYSASAMLALATTRREIETNGAFCFHDGSMEISRLDISKDGVLTPAVARNLEEMRNLNRSLLVHNGVKLTDDMVQLLGATGKLELTPQKCLDVGIVSRIV
jgi:ATP-dependent protease ClpP protease subunit